MRAQQFRTYMPLHDGSFLMKELPGPQSFQHWLACWRVLKVAALALGIISLASLQQYEKYNSISPSLGLISLADETGRAERLEKLRRGFLADKGAGRPLLAGWEEDAPWTVCFQKLARDDTFWSEQVCHPATAWIAAGDRGALMAPAESLAEAHLASGPDVVTPRRRASTDTAKLIGTGQTRSGSCFSCNITSRQNQPNAYFRLGWAALADSPDVI